MVGVPVYGWCACVFVAVCCVMLSVRSLCVALLSCAIAVGLSIIVGGTE